MKRGCADELERRVRDLIDNRLDAICGARNRRLAQLLQRLVYEFEGRRTPDELRACADAVLTRYDEAPVRSFLLTLADRATRECLSAESCFELTAP